MTEWLLNSDQAWINKGEIVEAFVGQELLSYANYEKIYSYPLYAVSMGIKSDLVKICSEWK